MRVFLTGAAGFIGAHITRRLLQDGCEVYALVRETTDLSRMSDIADNIQFVHGDLASISEESIRSIQPDVCIHAAWYAVPGRYLTAMENVDVLRESLQLVQILARAGCRRFVGIGTCFEYNFDYGYLSEQTPTLPKTIYAASKIALHTTLSQIQDLDVAWIRLFYQYGPYEDERRLVSSVINKLLRGELIETTSGEQVRDFLHVEDVASAVSAIARSNIVGAVNVGSGIPITVRQIIETIAHLTERDDLLRIGALPQRAGDPPFICANNTRLKSETDWQPRYTLESGLQHTIEWWRKRLEN